MAKDTRDWSRARLIDSGPAAGFYKVRLQPFCPLVAARVWLDVPTDDEGRLADRPRRLVCQINGEWASVYEFWDRMMAISREEYEWLVAHAPADPWARTVKGEGNGYEPRGDPAGRIQEDHSVGQLPAGDRSRAPEPRPA